MCCKSTLKRRHSATIIRLLQIEGDGPKTSRAWHQRFSFQSEKSRRGQTCNRSCEKRKSESKRQRQCLKQFREWRLHPLDHNKATVHLEKHARPSMTPKRKAKRRDDLVHLLRQVHRTEIGKVMEKVVVTEVQQAHQNSLVKVRQEKLTEHHG